MPLKFTSRVTVLPVLNLSARFSGHCRVFVKGRAVQSSKFNVQGVACRAV
jgi:hypothetical protein